MGGYHSSVSLEASNEPSALPGAALASPAGEPDQPGGAQPLGLAEETAVALLACLAERVGVPAEPQQLKSAWRGAVRGGRKPLQDVEPDRADWELLERAAEALGVRLTAQEAPPEPAAAGPRTPAVVATPCGWWIVEGRNDPPLGRRWGPGDPPEGLETRLDDALEAAGRWGIATPLAPCQPAQDEAHESISPWRRLLGLIAPERQDVQAVVLFALGTGFLSLATPVAVESLVGTVAFGGLLQPVVVLALVLMVCLGLAAGLEALKAWVVELLQRRLFVRVAADLAHRLPAVPLSTWDDHHGPELVNRFFDVVTVQKAGAKLLLDGVTVVLSATIGLLVLAFYHPVLLGFDLALLGALAFIVFVLGRGAVRTSVAESAAKYALADWLQELARHPLAFKTGRGWEVARDRADTLASAWVRRRAEHWRVVMRQLLGALSLQVLTSTLLLGLGGWLVEAGQLTLGQLVASWLIVSLVLGSIQKLGWHLEGIYDLLAAVDKLGHLFDLPREHAGGEAPPRGGGPAGLRLVRACTQLGQTTTSPASVEIAAGDRVALVGPGGSGKSALLDRLAGLRDGPGQVLVDGLDLRDLALRGWREQVALARRSELIHGTVEENVRMGRHALTLEELHAALDAVGLGEAVQALPGGLATELTTDGHPLSGGQARLLLLARAIAGRPRLLLVDGILDSVDAQARARALDRLAAPEAPWTLILVAQAPEALARCGRRLTLPGGTVEELPPAQGGSK